MSKNNKFIVWCAMVAVTSFWMWVSVNVWLKDPLFEFQNGAVIGILISLFVLLQAILSLGLVLFRNRTWSLILGFIVSITYLVIFGISDLNLVGSFILVMLLFHAQDIVDGEVKERIKMNSRLLLKKGLANSVVAFFVMMSFAAYQSPAIESFRGMSELPNSSQAYIKTVISRTMASRLELVGPSEREIILNEITQEIFREANLWLRPFFDYIPPALAFGLFIVLWGVSWIFIWLAVFLAMIFFQILKKFKFFRIEEYGVKAETIIV